MKKKSFIITLIVALVLFLRTFEVHAFSLADILVHPQMINQGDIGLIRISISRGERPWLSWLQKDVILHANDDMTEWFGFLGTDLSVDPGIYPLQITDSSTREELVIEIGVMEKDYGVRNLTLPGHMVDLDAETWSRVRGEARIMQALWQGPYPESLWRKAFIKPLEGEIIGPFGRRSVINRQPRSPHSGVDFRAPKGTPVKAMNNGRVVLVADHFFSGKSVVVDHGGGIQSMYFHLDRIMVNQEEEVIRGQVLGEVGSTGRATGPHLHLGVRVNGARVDPTRLIELSQQVD